MNPFTITYKDNDNKINELFEYDEKLNEAIKKMQYIL